MSGTPHKLGPITTFILAAIGSAVHEGIEHMNIYDMIAAKAEEAYVKFHWGNPLGSAKAHTELNALKKYARKHPNHSERLDKNQINEAIEAGEEIGKWRVKSRREGREL